MACCSQENLHLGSSASVPSLSLHGGGEHARHLFLEASRRLRAGCSGVGGLQGGGGRVWRQRRWKISSSVELPVRFELGTQLCNSVPFVPPAAHRGDVGTAECAAAVFWQAGLCAGLAFINLPAMEPP